MASKQIKSAADAGKERPHATLPSFGVADSGDPWRQGPALAGLHQALQHDASKPYGDKSQAYTDRYGTGVARDVEYKQPPRAEATQNENAKTKGGAVGGYRAPLQEEVIQ